MVEKTRGRTEEVVTREYTVNLHKRLHGWLVTAFSAYFTRFYQMLLFYYCLPMTIKMLLFFIYALNSSLSALIELVCSSVFQV